jgi:hypothetical protein
MPLSTKPALLQTNKKQPTSFQIDVPRKCRAKGCFHANAWQTL